MVSLPHPRRPDQGHRLENEGATNSEVVTESMESGWCLITILAILVVVWLLPLRETVDTSRRPPAELAGH
jgi:hypothetical protein